MPQSNLETIESLVNTLEIGDQVRLLQYLAPRIADAVLPRSVSIPNTDEAWIRFRKAGKKVAAAASGSASLTQALGDSRR
jgi:uncharacterized protein (DUF2236 family)